MVAKSEPMPGRGSARRQARADQTCSLLAHELRHEGGFDGVHCQWPLQDDGSAQGLATPNGYRHAEPRRTASVSAAAKRATEPSLPRDEATPLLDPHGRMHMGTAPPFCQSALQRSPFSTSAAVPSPPALMIMAQLCDPVSMEPHTVCHCCTDKSSEAAKRKARRSVPV
jgi:hypothetical protein